MYLEGGRQGIFHTFSPPSETAFIVGYEFVLVKLRDYLKRWGVVLVDYQHVASKVCLEKGGEGVSYIDFTRPWIFDAHGVLDGGVQMKYHECMHLGGQQHFHAALSLYMKVVLRILNAIVCSGCC
jgi:hypothetical protein